MKRFINKIWLAILELINLLSFKLSETINDKIEKVKREIK